MINKNLILLLFGKLVSLTGTLAFNFGLSIYVLETTGSTTLFASVLAFSILPKIILTPFFGVMSDWCNRKKIIVSLDFLSAFLVIMTGILYSYQGFLGMPIIYALTMMLSLLIAFYNPTVAAVIPSIVKKEQLLKVNGIDSYISSIAALSAPLLATIILNQYGILALIVINGISFFLSGVSELFMDIPTDNVNKKVCGINWLSKFKTDFMEGIRYVFNKRMLLNIFILIFIANLTFNPMFSVVIPFVNVKLLGVPKNMYGMFQTVLVTSMFLAPFLTKVLKSRLEEVNILKIAILIFPIIFVFVGLLGQLFLVSVLDMKQAYLLILMLYYIISVLTTVFNIIVNTMIQKNTPNDLMGRVNAVSYTLSFAAMPIGQLFFGTMLDRQSLLIVTIVIAIILGATGILFNVLTQNAKDVQLDE